MSEDVSPQDKLNKLLDTLYIAMPEAVAKDAGEKIRAVFDEQKKASADIAYDTVEHVQKYGGIMLPLSHHVKYAVLNDGKRLGEKG